MATNGSHPELIENSFFNEKFKNNLRDFFVYQFKESDPKGDSGFKKRRSNENKPANTFGDERQRLQTLLSPSSGVEWEKQRKKVYCCTADSRQIPQNPFFPLYQSCMDAPEEIVWLFTVLFALHPAVSTRLLPEDSLPDLLALLKKEAEYSAGGKPWEKLSKSDRRIVGNEALQEFLTEKDRLLLALSQKKIDVVSFSLQDTGLPLALTTRQLQLYCRLHGCSEITDKRFTARMRELAELGILQEVSQRGGKNLCWALKQNPLSPFLAQKDFASRLKEMLRFFAETSPLGTVGFLLGRRIGGESEKEPPLFAFKHNYMIRAVNDYNLADLLWAIEEKKCLEIRYRNGIRLHYQEIICLPLALRESAVSGRQYLICYHPARRSVSSLRVDFIDEILPVTLSSPIPREDLENAAALIQGCWGASFLYFLEGNAAKPPSLFRLRAVIDYDPVREAFIKNRLEREKRQGEISSRPGENGREELIFTLFCSDPAELIPWLRSFTGRLLSVEVNGRKWGDFTKDAQNALSLYLSREEHKEKLPASPVKPVLLETALLPEFREETAFLPHNGIFHPLFSSAFLATGMALLSLARDAREPEKLLRRSLSQAGILEDSEVALSVRDNLQLLCGYYHTGRYDPPYRFPQPMENPYSLLPLTLLEERWLAGILRDPKAGLFLTAEELLALKEHFPEEKALPLEKISCFDQFCDVSPIYSQKKIHEIFSLLFKGTRLGQKLLIRYLPKDGEILEETASPVRLEYSKREDRIRLYGLSEEGKARIFNLERIQEATLLDCFFNKEEALLWLSQLENQNRQTVVVTFQDQKGVPDRILTEFSPFKKRCFLDKQTGVYTMSVEYDALDAFELAIRILSYGDSVTVTDDTGPLKEEVLTRLKTQLSRSLRPPER